MSATQQTYFSVAARGEAEFKDRGSRFIGIALAVKNPAEIKSALEAIKIQYPRATHYCYAWRLGFSKSAFRANDDGEPSGSAGKPILGQIDSAELTQLLVVVVRYYGGSKLGVPGLINAYKTAAAQAIQQAGILEFDRCRYAELEFDYTLMNEVMRCLKPFHVQVEAQDMGLFCTQRIAIPLRVFSDVEQKLNDLRGLQIKWLPEEQM